MEIETGKYWHIFRNRFEDYFNILANSNLKRLSKMSPEEFFSNPNIMLHGIETTILKLITRTLFRRIFKIETKMQQCQFEVVNSSNKYNCPYEYCETYTEIDMAKIVSAEKQFLTDFVCNHIATHKNIYQQKHIVVMHNTDSLGVQSSFALRRTLESYSKNVVFFFTARSFSNLESAIQSRFMFVRCNVPIDYKIAFLEKFLDDNSIEHQIEIDPRDSIVEMLLKISSNNNVENTIETTIRKFLQGLFLEKNILKACEITRTFAYKILHFNVTFARIAQDVIDVLSTQRKFVNKMHDVVQLSADMETESHSVSKKSLILEQYFLCLYSYANMK